MANPLKVLTELQVSGALNTSGSLSVGGGGSLTVANGATVTAGGLTVTAGGVTVSAGNINASAVEVSASALNVTNNALVGGNLTVTGDLTVNGTTTTINTTNLVVEDHNIILGAVTTPTDSTADGGGITLSGSTNKTFQWSNTTDSWTSSEHLDLASGKAFKIGTVEAVKQASFSQGVENDSITLDITGSQLVSGSSTAALIGVGAATAVGMGSIGSAALLKGDVALVRGGSLGVKIEASGSGQGGVTIGAYGDGETITLTGSAGSVTLSQLVTAVAGGSSVSITKYYGVRTVVSGTKQSGNDTVVFTISGSNNQGESGRTPSGAGLTNMSASDASSLISLMGGMSVDVAIKANGTNTWTNDLVSVQISASAPQGGFYWPQVTIDAPSLTDSSLIRLIVVNENENVIS